MGCGFQGQGQTTKTSIISRDSTAVCGWLRPVISRPVKAKHSGPRPMAMGRSAQRKTGSGNSGPRMPSRRMDHWIRVVQNWPSFICISALYVGCICSISLFGPILHIVAG